MVATAEAEKVPPLGKSSVEVIPESPQIPEHLEKGGVTSTPANFTAQVTDDQGRPLIQTPQNSVTITLPSDEESLSKLSKGSITDSISWFARYWLRMLKKAIHYGWKVVVRK